MNGDAFSISDGLLTACFVVGVVFSLTFGLGKPRVWFHDLLGWVIFLYSLAVDALLFLIVWGIVVGQKIEEPARVVISSALLGALASKLWILHKERQRGRRANERPQKKVEEVRDA